MLLVPSWIGSSALLYTVDTRTEGLVHQVCQMLQCTPDRRAHSSSAGLASINLIQLTRISRENDGSIICFTSMCQRVNQLGVMVSFFFTWSSCKKKDQSTLYLTRTTQKPEFKNHSQINNKIKKYPTNISIQTLTVKLMWDGWEGLTSSSESTSVKLNGLDLFVKVPTCVNKALELIEQTTAKIRSKLRSKEWPEEFRESCSKTQTTTRLEFCFTDCFYELSGLHILIWKNFGSSRTSYSCCLNKLKIWGEESCSER